MQIEKGIVLNKAIPEGFIITDENIAKIYPDLIKNNDTDSSIGGKTGINLNEKKNYIGTFYQPDEILIDTLFLQSLPEEEFENGIAEIIKYSVIFQKPNLERLEKPLKKNNEDIIDIIKECCEIKLSIVEKDEKDKGFRHILNFGHTIGHAIELLAGIKHGRAVSIGMVKEAQIGEQLKFIQKGTAEKLKKILQVNNLPTQMPNDLNINNILELIKRDKKGSFVFAFSKDNFNVKVEENAVREILNL
jgi:3-dehydroquinate synthase